MTTTYSVSDNNYTECELLFVDAVEQIAEWFRDCDEWATGDGNEEQHAAVSNAIDSISAPTDGDAADLQSYADTICEAVAKAMGKKDFAGHGNYYVSAAASGGFNLSVEEEEEDEPIEIEVEFHDSNPAVSGPSDFAKVTIEVDSWDDAASAVRNELTSQVLGLEPCDGYCAGDRIWATWEDEDGQYREIVYRLIDEDLA